MCGDPAEHPGGICNCPMLPLSSAHVLVIDLPDAEVVLVHCPDTGITVDQGHHVRQPVEADRLV